MHYTSKFFWSFFIFFSLVFSPSLMALDFFFDYSTFYVPNEKPYVETYLSIPANSLNLESHPDSTYSGSAEVTVTFSQDGVIRQFDKYLIKSPILDNSTVNKLQLLDTKRFALSPGDYLLELSLKDVRLDSVSSDYSEQITVKEFLENKPAISELTLLESFQQVDYESDFTKNGIEMLPQVFPFYSDKTPILRFYCETYFTNQFEEESHLLNYYITKDGANRVMGNKRRFKKQKGELVNVIFGELEVSDLKSGNYDLVVEIRNQKNELLFFQRKTFQRYNKNAQSLPDKEEDLEDIIIHNTFVDGLTMEEVQLYVGAIEPLVSPQQAKLLYTLLSRPNELTLKKYLFNFWTANAPNDPEQDFINYVKLVNLVESRYGSKRIKGYTTDRGFTYLKYGKPNEVIVQGTFDPGAMPYEIWEYYTIPNGQRNVIFVFYNSNIASDDYTLLHSSARGEIQEPRWKKIIYREVGADDFNLDDNSVDDNWGGGF